MTPKRYWLRGGIIGAVLGVIYFLFVGFLAGNFLAIPSIVPISITKVLYFLHYFDLIMYATFSRACIDIECAFTVFTTPISLIFEGMFIGLVYGRLKNK